MAPTNTTRPATSRTGEHVDPADLICPECTEQVRCAPPGYWRVAWGLPAAGFSHWDGSALVMNAAQCSHTATSRVIGWSVRSVTGACTRAARSHARVLVTPSDHRANSRSSAVAPALRPRSTTP